MQKESWWPTGPWQPHNVNSSPPDAHIIHWLRSQAPRLANRDEGDKSSIPLGLFAFFCGNISLAQAVELIKTRNTNDETAVNHMRTQFRTNKVESRIPRQAHPKQAILAQKALASGSQAPRAPATPHITPLPEGFALEPPVPPSQLSQPASARGKAPKRPAPEGSISIASEGLTALLGIPAHTPLLTMTSSAVLLYLPSSPCLSLIILANSSCSCDSVAVYPDPWSCSVSPLLLFRASPGRHGETTL